MSGEREAEAIRMRAGSETLHAHLEQLSEYSGLSDDGKIAVETALRLAREDIPALLLERQALRERAEAAEQNGHETSTYLDELRHIYEDTKRELVAAEERLAALGSPHLVDALESLLDKNDWRDLPSREMAEKMIVLVKLAFDLAAAGRRIGRETE